MASVIRPSLEKHKSASFILFISSSVNGCSTPLINILLHFGIILSRLPLDVALNPLSFLVTVVLMLLVELTSVLNLNLFSLTILLLSKLYSSQNFIYASPKISSSSFVSL